VPMAYRVVNEVDAAGIDDKVVYNNATSPTGARDKEGSLKSSVAGTAGGTAGGANGTGRKMDEDEERDAVFFRLESLGYRVGQGLVERFVFSLHVLQTRPLALIPFPPRSMHTKIGKTNNKPPLSSFSRDRPRFTDTLDVIKFLCKDLWMLVFRKQIDNLKTNHRGVYVLTDNSFKPFSRMSTEAGGQAVVRAQPVGFPLFKHVEDIRMRWNHKPLLTNCQSIVPLVPLWHYPRCPR
jgi:hypothetical protein